VWVSLDISRRSIFSTVFESQEEEEEEEEEEDIFGTVELGILEHRT
jgi:hypothetical protein